MSNTVVFQPATEADFERLLELRIRVLRPHLERVGRFDPARARAATSATATIRPICG
ncbi:hypothetical protein BAL199_05344 [alpha proteobacterium BAL199]|nr:hypothetical protein BAL199_05344 [alpha proteobacterium BAL199]